MDTQIPSSGEKEGDDHPHREQRGCHSPGDKGHRGAEATRHICHPQTRPGSLCPSKGSSRSGSGDLTLPTSSWSCPNITDVPVLCQGIPAPSTALRGLFPGFWHSLFILKNPKLGDKKSSLSWDPVLGVSSIPKHPQGEEVMSKAAPSPLCQPVPWQEKGFPSRATERGGKGWRGNVAMPGNPFPAQQQPLPAAGAQSRSSGMGQSPESAIPAPPGWKRSRGVSSTYTVLSTGIYKPIDPLFSGRDYSRLSPAGLTAIPARQPENPALPSHIPGVSQRSRAPGCSPCTPNDIPGEQNRHRPTTSPAARKGNSTRNLRTRADI